MSHLREGRGRAAVRGLAVAVAFAAVLAAVAPLARAQGQAALTPPHADAGVDLDGDTLFDVLRIGVNLDASVAGQFFISVDLYDNADVFWITGAATPIMLNGPGTATVDLSGIDIRTSMFDGPYNAHISVFDDVFNLDDFGIHVTAGYLWTQFEQPGLTFAPPHADSGIDTDGDALFDLLRVSWTVNVVDPGLYDFNAVLYDQFFNFIDSTPVRVMLAPGSQVVDTDFRGWRIRLNGVDGPFTADGQAYDAMGNYLGADTHVTAGYLWNQFEMPPLSFAPPHADSAVDTDGDTLFDVLWVNWTVNVDVPGTYTFYVDLYDQFFNYIAGDSVSVPLAAGFQVVSTDFQGWRIRMNGVDGPFTATAQAYESTGGPVGADTHVTAGYLWNQFEMPPLSFAPPHADSAVDTDGDTLFDVLWVNWTVNVDVPGTYTFFVDLYDQFFNWIDNAYVTVPLAAGFQVVSTDFQGWRIWMNGVDGPFTADAQAYDRTGNYLGTDTHVTAAYPWTQFEPTPAVFAPPHADSALDTDGDTLFDILRISWGLNVNQAGTYSLFVNLYDQFFNWIDDAYVTVPLAAGFQVVNTDFAGWRIWMNGVDGPFTADARAYDAMGDYLGTDTHVTAGYAWTQFDTPPASIAPPHADSGIDTDGDALFDEIAIDVRLQVDVAGDYAVQVNLWDSFGFINLGWNNTFATLGVGPQVVTLDFSTLPMVSQGIAGPYLARIDLYTDAFDLLGSDTHMTQAYPLSQFDGLPAYLAPPHSDVGIDRDLPPDGQFNVLQVAVRLQVNDTGLYAIGGQLWDLLMTTNLGVDVAIVPLAAGPQTVFLNFSGVPIRASGISGPYVVELVLFAATGGMPTPIGFGTHTTNPYPSTDFQDVVPETLSGTVRGLPAGTPIPFASVFAFDYLNEQWVSGSTDGTGSYALPLYRGDWVLLFDDSAYGSELRWLTIISGPATYDVDLFPTPPNPETVDIVMPSWTDSDWTFTSTGESDNRTFRLQFDWEYGDRDQVLSQAEFDNYIRFLGFALPTPPGDTVDAFEVDGATYDLVPGSEGFQFQNIAGPIDSTTPPRWAMTGSYTNGSIAPAPTHTIDANVEYDTSSTSYAYSVTLPPGFVLRSYATPPEVTVTGVGTNVAVVDPGLDPNPFDLITSVWIQLVAGETTAPTVSSAVASPDPSDLGQPVTVTAVATDNYGIGSVRLEVWDSGGTLVLNVTMTPAVPPDSYEHTFTPSAVGAYTFRVTAVDMAGNTASRGGTFDVIERNPPVVTGVGATPNPQGSGLPVLLSATVTDDTGVASVSVEVRDAGGAGIGNYTMTYNATSGEWEVTRSFLDIGTLSFTVWATDTFGNVGSASGTFGIRDQTAPTADAGPDETVIAGVAVTFDGTGSSDNDRIAGYWWNFTDGGARSLTGATPSYTFDTPGTYVVTLTVVDPAGNADTDSVTIVVTPAVGTVEGTVTGTSSAPVAGATVQLMNGTTEVDSTTTDANGDYDFADVPPGDYAVRVTAAGYDAATRDVTVVAGQTATVDVQLMATQTGILGLPAWVWILLVVIIIAAVALAFLMWKRRKPAEAPPAAPAPVVETPPTPPPQGPPSTPEAPAAPPATPSPESEPPPPPP